MIWFKCSNWSKNRVYLKSFLMLPSHILTQKLEVERVSLIHMALQCWQRTKIVSLKITQWLQKRPSWVPRWHPPRWKKCSAGKSPVKKYTSEDPRSKVQYPLVIFNCYHCSPVENFQNRSPVKKLKSTGSLGRDVEKRIE